MESVHREKGDDSMKRYYKMAGTMLLVMIAIIVYVLIGFEIEDMTLLRGRVDTFNKGWVLVREDGSREEITLPCAKECKPEEIITMENTIPRNFYGKTMSFLSADKIFTVYIDGKKVYEFGENDKRKFGKTPGSIYNFIDIPRDIVEGKIEIVMHSPYASYAANITSIEVAEKDVSALNLLGRSIVPLICNVIILIIAILFLSTGLLQAIVERKTNGKGFIGLYFLFSFLFYCIETKALSIFYGNQTLYSVMVFLILMSFPILFGFYYGKRLAHSADKYQKRCKMILLISFANMIIQFSMQLLNIKDFLEMASMTHIIIFISLLIIIISVIQVNKETKDVGYKIEAIGLFFLGVGSVTDIVRSEIWHIGDMGKYGRYGAVVFSIAIMFTEFRTLMFTLQNQLEKHNLILQEKMEQLEEKNKELEIAREDAVAANSAKSDFLANMSHEIRTPINTVLGLNEMILQETKEKVIRGYSENIKGAAHSLLGIINDILDLSKIEAGKMMLVPVEYNIGDMVFELANMISVRAASKNLEFQIAVNPELPSKLYGDDMKIRQIVTNLLTNAVKYTHSGIIRMTVDGEVDGEVDGNRLLLEISVEDTGIGIKPEDIQKLFHAFERIEESRNRNIEGTGLGMNITMQLLKMMDGELFVESEYGKGSKFYFELEQQIIEQKPIGNIAERFKQTNRNEIRESFIAPRAKVLVVDDNMMNRRVFAGLLKKTRIQIDEADSGRTCLEMIRKQAYDIIFLDHMMPEMDGIETLHHMQEMEESKCREARVICLTANAISGAEAKYMEEGFDGYLSKPILVEKLEQCIVKNLPSSYIEKCQVSSSSIQEDDIKLPTIEGFFWERPLANQYKTNIELLEAIKEYRANLPSLIGKLSALMEQLEDDGAREEYGKEIHILQNRASMIGGMRVAGMSRSMEQALQNPIDRESVEHLKMTIIGELKMQQEILGKI